MPPRRTRSTSATTKAKSPSKSQSPRPSGRASGRPSAGSAAPVISKEAQQLIEEALAKARQARGQQVAAAGSYVDGEKDSAPERAQISGGFFSANDRIYSRKTTQCLTDLAGFLLLAFLAFYFTIFGYGFFVEFAKRV